MWLAQHRILLGSKFTSTANFIRSDKCACPLRVPAATHSHATRTHPNRHQFHSQHSDPTTDSTIHKYSSFPLCRARGLCWQPDTPSLPDKQLLQWFVQHNKAGSVWEGRLGPSHRWGLGGRTTAQHFPLCFWSCLLALDPVGKAQLQDSVP